MLQLFVCLHTHVSVLLQQVNVLLQLGDERGQVECQGEKQKLVEGGCGCGGRSCCSNLI